MTAAMEMLLRMVSTWHDMTAVMEILLRMVSTWHDSGYGDIIKNSSTWHNSSLLCINGYSYGIVDQLRDEVGQQWTCKLQTWIGVDLDQIGIKVLVYKVQK